MIEFVYDDGNPTGPPRDITINYTSPLATEDVILVPADQYLVSDIACCCI